jgi:hypothetical protein
MARRLFRKAVQQGRSERRGDAYSVRYVEPLSDARTPLADFINNLLAGLQPLFDNQRRSVRVAPSHVNNL